MTTTIDAPRAHDRPRTRPPFVALGVTSVLVGVAVLWGGRLDLALHMHLNAAPLYGDWEPRWGWPVLVAVVVAIVVTMRLDEVDTFRRSLAASFVAAIVWGVALALVDPDGLTKGITGPHGYLTILDRVRGPGSFVATFVERIADYTVHVRGHPPALMSVLWWLDRAGLGSGAIAGLVVVAGSSTVPAVMLATRAVVDADAARRAAPFLVLAPAAIWMVTTFDALYAAVAAWGIALVAVATTNRGRRADAAALAGGAILGVGLFLSYGLAVLGLVPLALVLRRRSARVLLVAAAAVVVVVAAFAVGGFWWIEGLAATRIEYAKGIASVRPYGYFLLGNLAAFALALGPAPVAGLGVLRDRRVWVLVGAGLACVLLANASGLSKGEVERIWLPFWPWVGLAAAGLARTHRRWWIAGHAGFAIALHLLVKTPW